MHVYIDMYLQCVLIDPVTFETSGIFVFHIG